MWYIMDTEKDSEIVLGMKDKNADLSVLNNISNKNVDEVFNRVKVENGDSYFIPAGKIHAIGSGVLAAEIQQTSDITYRVYDWDRKDDLGKKRELHTDLAIQAVRSFDYDSKCDYEIKKNKACNLVNNQYFTTNIIEVKDECKRDYNQIDSFKIIMCVEGFTKVTVDGFSEFIKKGETVLIPAKASDAIFNANSSKLLEIYIDL